MPKNEGSRTLTKALGTLKLVQKYELELSNMEGTPTYSLTHQLTVGREIGNIVIADPSISPRHATFMLQQEVVSVIDHGSIAGTMINGKKIPPGRNIVLEETDVVAVGDLEIRLKVYNENVPAEEIPEIPKISMEEGPKVEEASPVVEKEESEISGETTPVIENKVEEAKLKPVITDKRAANALVRIVAVFVDIFFSWGILVIFLSFDEFRSFVSSFPDIFGTLLNSDFHGLMKEVTGPFGGVTEDLVKFLGEVFIPLPLLMTFLTLRFVSTLIFGVSLGEFLLFVRARGHWTWSRIGGGIRVLLGVLTGPFLLFDVPAIFSRRTFKEILTFTHVQANSKLLTIIASLLFLPLSLGLALLAPLFQGLEMTEAVPIVSEVEERIKVINSDASVSSGVKIRSQEFLNFELEFGPENLTIMPMFKFQGTNKKLNYRTQALFYSRDMQRAVTVEVLKIFDLKQLLGIGIRGNFFLYEKFPEIYSYVYEAQGSSLFKRQIDAKSEEKFANEFIGLSKLAFELSAGNVIDVMWSSTPLVKGLVDFKDSFLNLVEYKEPDSIGFIKLGNAVFMKFTYLESRPFDLLIPLIRGKGRILKVNFDKSENVGELSTNFYKYVLERSDWFVSGPVELTLNAFTVLDQFMSIRHLPAEMAQLIYGYYFEKTTEVLERDEAIEIDLWKKSVESFFKVLEALRAQDGESEAGETPMSKLYQNFRDLFDALENKNREYFGITERRSV